MNFRLLLPLTVLFLFSHFNVDAQRYQMECTMTFEEVMLNQPFDIDEPVAEFARDVATELLEEITFIYDKLNLKEKKDLDVHKSNVQELIKEADRLGMNHSMFDNDVKFIEKKIK